MNKRGVFFTLDAVIAVLAAIVLIGMALFYIEQVDINGISENELLEYSRGVITVMEKGGFLESAVEEDSMSEIGGFLIDYTKENACFNISIYDGDLVYTGLNVVKDGCGSSEDFVLVKRSFVIDTDWYLAKMEVYYE